MSRILLEVTWRWWGWWWNKGCGLVRVCSGVFWIGLRGKVG